MNIEIVEAKIDDLESLWPVFEECEDLHVQEIAEVFIKMPKEQNCSYIKDYINEEDKIVLLAKTNDSEIAGLLMAMKKERSECYKIRNIVSVNEMAVLAKYKRNGIGVKLYSSIKEWAKKQGAREVELNVYNQNLDAVKFYESIGLKARRTLMAENI